MTPTQLEPYWEQYHVLTELLKEVQHDTQYLQQAITSLERVPSGNIPGDIAGQAKADALGKAIQTRETTHQQLLQIYARDVCGFEPCAVSGRICRFETAGRLRFCVQNREEAFYGRAATKIAYLAGE